MTGGGCCWKEGVALCGEVLRVAATGLSGGLQFRTHTVMSPLPPLDNQWSQKQRTTSAACSASSLEQQGRRPTLSPRAHASCTTSGSLLSTEVSTTTPDRLLSSAKPTAACRLQRLASAWASAPAAAPPA
jgi:hypothetical protein